MKFVLLSVLVLLFAVAGCSSNAPATEQTQPSAGSASRALPTIALAPSLPPPTETQVPTAVPTPTSNPLDALSRVVGTLTAVKAFRAQVAVTGGTSSTQNGTLFEVVEPDRLHVLVPGTGEVIQIGQTYYYRQGANGKWTKASFRAGVTPPAPRGLAFDPRALVAKIVSAKGVSFGGPDILGGRPMLTYSYTADPAQDKSMVSGKMWVGATDGLPYKLQATESNHAVLTVTYTYDPSIAINAPIP